MNLLLNLIIICFIYLLVLLIWFMINASIYFLSILLKKPHVVTYLDKLTDVLFYLTLLLLGGYTVLFSIQQLLKGNIFGFVLNLMITLTVSVALLAVLQYPFRYIPTFFLNKMSKIDLDEDVVDAEILDSNKNVVGRTFGNTSISTRLAKYFLALFVYNMIYIIIFPTERNSMRLLDWITKPFLQIVGDSFFVGVPYIVYYKLRYKIFLPIDKRLFWIQIWKVFLYIAIPLSIGLFLISIATNTY